MSDQENILNFKLKEVQQKLYETQDKLASRIEYIESLQYRISLQQKNQVFCFNDMWNLLDGIMRQSNDTVLWFDSSTTAHERLIEIAGKYNVAVEQDLRNRLEDNEMES